MRCHHIIDPEIGKVFIPGCMGAAIYGIHRCTCYNLKTAREFEKEEFNKILKEKENTINALEHSLNEANETIEKLIQSIRTYEHNNPQSGIKPE